MSGGALTNLHIGALFDITKALFEYKSFALAKTLLRPSVYS